MFDNGSLTIGIVALITILGQSGFLGYWIAKYENNVKNNAKAIEEIADRVSRLEPKLHEIDKTVHVLRRKE